MNALTRCKHFTGIQNKTCAVGVAYADVKDTVTRPYRWPCLDTDVPNVCLARVYPTQEEIDAEDAAFDEQMKNVDMARRVIVAVTGNKRGVSGDTACPVCDGGTLRYSVARSNGHIHAACSTATCVRWME
jgi:hypothetical protein